MCESNHSIISKRHDFRFVLLCVKRRYCHHYFDIFQYSYQFLAPFAYSPEKCNLDHQPSYSFGGKYNLSKPSGTPCKSLNSAHLMAKFPHLHNNHFSFAAPTAYQTEKVNLNHSPAYTFGTKANHEKYIETPAPSAYSPEKIETHPSFSFGGKYNLSKPSETPCTSFRPL